MKPGVEEIRAALKQGADAVMADMEAGTELRRELAKVLQRFDQMNDRTVCVNLLGIASALAQLNKIGGPAFHALAGIVDVMLRETAKAVAEQPEGGAVISFLVLYDHPQDWPTGWVLREHSVLRGGVTAVAAYAFAFRSEQAARAFLMDTPWTYLPRHPDDDPKIVGSWVL